MVLILEELNVIVFFILLFYSWYSNQYITLSGNIFFGEGRQAQHQTLLLVIKKVTTFSISSSVLLYQFDFSY